MQSFATGQSADVVIGQSDFVSQNSTATASHLSYPRGLTFDSQGNLWVADAHNDRVLEFLKGSGFTNGESASIVIGQPNFTSTAPTTTASGLSYPWMVAFDASGNLWVSDDHNSRILEYLKGGGFVTGQSAALVIGQPNFTSSECVDSPPTATGLCNETYIEFDSAGNLWTADEDRVLEYLKGGGFTTGQAASLVIGQPNMTSYTFATDAKGLEEPDGLAFDSSGNLWVADLGSNRILEYLLGGGFSSGQSASLVIGQSDFTSRGNGTTASTLYWPREVGFDQAGNLWAADSLNNRVLEYIKGAGFVSGQNASLAIGQHGLMQNFAGRNVSALDYPNGLAFDPAGNLWVSDSQNGRVLSFSSAVGQGNQTTTSFTASATTSTNLTTTLTNSTTSTINSTTSLTTSSHTSESHTHTTTRVSTVNSHPSTTTRTSTSSSPSSNVGGGSGLSGYTTAIVGVIIVVVFLAGAYVYVRRRKA